VICDFSTYENIEPQAEDGSENGVRAKLGNIFF